MTDYTQHPIEPENEWDDFADALNDPTLDELIDAAEDADGSEESR